MVDECPLGVGFLIVEVEETGPKVIVVRAQVGVVVVVRVAEILAKVAQERNVADDENDVAERRKGKDAKKGVRNERENENGSERGNENLVNGSENEAEYETEVKHKVKIQNKVALTVQRQILVKRKRFKVNRQIRKRQAFTNCINHINRNQSRQQRKLNPIHIRLRWFVR